MIREATMEDIPRCVDLIYQFYGQSFWQETPWDPEQAEYLSARAITTDNWLLALSDERDSITMNYVAPPLWSRTFQVVYDVAFLAGGDALSMLSYIQRWAEGQGANYIVTGSHEGMKDPAPIYKRKGYTPMERVWVKEV